MSRSQTQRGSAIIMLFIAIALFGMLAYAFMQGSRGSSNMITGESAKVNSAKMQDCANTVNMATKRLQLRGCGDKISLATDGSNSIPGAPSDGSCSVYHVRGGGVKFCELPVAPADPCTTGPLGTTCVSDGAKYIGTAGATRLYIYPSDSSAAAAWKTTASTTAGASSTTDGLANTDAMIADSAVNHPAAAACRALGAQWYLPSKTEFQILTTNGPSMGSPGSFALTQSQVYWTSTEDWSAASWIFSINASGGQDVGGGQVKTSPARVRCFRR